MSMMDLGKCQQSGIYVNGQIDNAPMTSFEYTHIKIKQNSSLQIWTLINIYTKKQKMFYRVRHGERYFGPFCEIANPEEV